MKKILLSLLICVLVTSLVFATGTGSSKQSNQGNQPEVTGQQKAIDNSNDTVTNTQIKQQEQNQRENKTQKQIKEQIQSGNFTTQGGKKVQVQTKNNNQTRLRSGNAEAKTSMQMTQEQTETGKKLQVRLSNGKNTEVKVMPDTASETALEKLRLKTCSTENGCSIELKEVGKGKQIKAAYEVQVKKQAKVLGLFKTKMQVQAQVNAENGEVIQTKKPWWAFLASESKE